MPTTPCHLCHADHATPYHAISVVPCCAVPSTPCHLCQLCHADHTTPCHIHGAVPCQPHHATCANCATLSAPRHAISMVPRCAMPTTPCHLCHADHATPHHAISMVPCRATPCPSHHPKHPALTPACAPPSAPQGCAALAWRWRHSLRELDLAGLCFGEQDLAQALAAFGPAAPLRSLELAGTRVAPEALSALLLRCPSLLYLDVSSCRRLPRGTKRAHRGRAELGRCLRLLLGAGVC
uniref:Uncharacterized protein n=1 Tax=Cairina moschata TaxID=8855 RepID=A0A8C3BR80_CAIMO